MLKDPWTQRESKTGPLIVAASCNAGLRMKLIAVEVRFTVQLEQAPGAMVVSVPDAVGVTVGPEDAR